MPKLIGLNEQYKEKGLTMIFLAYESKDKLETYAKQYKVTWPIALEPTKTAQKAYGVRGYPTSFVIAPNGKVAWQGHPNSKELEAVIKSLLSKVKKSSGNSDKTSAKEKPTELKLKDDIVDRLKTAARRAERGELASALRTAEKVLADKQAKDDEKEDAKYVKEEVEKLADKLFKEVEELLKEKKPYEARQLLFKLRGAFSGTDYSTKAQEKMDEIDEDESLKDELAAGKIYAKGLKYESQEKADTAKKMFTRIVDKYPETEYAKRAKEKLKSLEEEKD